MITQAGSDEILFDDDGEHLNHVGAQFVLHSGA